MGRQKRRPALLQGASLSALLVALAAPPARGAPFKSLAQGLALSARTAGASSSPAAAAGARQQASLGAQALTKAATRFASLATALANAASSSGGGIVVDGYGPGRGLQAAEGATAGGALWRGAGLPTTSTSTSGGAVTVTVTQTSALAQLTWKTFNVGAKTTLDFNQSAGGTLASSWVVINTVQDPLASGTQILGEINAPGKVYVLDRNGIAFGSGSTINVGSLIAATADIASSQFSTTASGVTSFNLYGALNTTTSTLTGLQSYYNPTFDNGTSAGISVAPGAAISTAAPTGNAGGGYVMLLGGNVSNAGVISTPQGQTILAAGTDFTLRQGTQGSTTTGNTTATTLGSEIASTNIPVNGLTGLPTTSTAGAVFTTGSVVNSGVIVSDQGDITLVGHQLTQTGVLLATTTVDTRGTIHLLTPTDGSDPTSSITLGPQSVTEILPEDDGETALDSQRAADVADSATLNAVRANLAIASAANPQLNNHDILPDEIEESRVEISTGGSVDFQSGALVDAPGGQIAVGGGSSVLVETGATLDVAGSTDAVLQAGVNALLVNIQPYQLRDSATNRDGALKGTNAYVDARSLVEIASGAYAGNIYTPGGLLEVSGYLGLVEHGIDEWTATGGLVTLQAAQTILDPATGKTVSASGTVITQPGSSINLQGGSVTYAAGPVDQSYVETDTGVVYNVNDAPANLDYVGLYSGQVFDHPRWQITDTYANPLLTPATIIDPTYVVGRDAGTLTVSAASMVLDGSVSAGVMPGTYQTGARPAGITDAYLLAQTVVPQAGALLIGTYVTGILQPVQNDTNFVFQASGPAAASLSSAAGSAASQTTIIAAPLLNADGFATLSVTTSGSISIDAPIAVADGGSVTLAGAQVDVNADITARSGGISLTNELIVGTVGVPLANASAIVLDPGATLDARGIWTNAQLDPASTAGFAFANGGTVSISSPQGVTLSAGSTIDVSSGGGILASGAQLTAAGGSVSVMADVILPEASQTSVHPVVLDADFIGYGSKGGGTLSLVALDIEIGQSAIPSFDRTAINPSLFSTGFSDYVVNGTTGLTVSAGTQIAVTEPIYELSGSGNVPSGEDPSTAYSVVLPLLYTQTKGSDAFTERGGASISLLSSIDPTHAASGGGGPVTIGAGASVGVDPGQAITVAGYGQVTVLGTLTAHAGTINVANTRFDPETQISTVPIPSEYAAGVSVWLGDGSLLDVSGIAVQGADDLGRVFGLASAGGTIALGGYLAGGSAGSGTISTWAQVIVRPGATLDADGAQTTVDLVPGSIAGSVVVASAPVTLAGNGGTIEARSLTGVALDGTLSAAAGSGGAAGGVLSLSLDPTQLGAYDNIPTYVYQPREILVSQNSVPVQTDPTLMPSDISPASSFGLVRVSQQQIAAGGFDSVDLTAQAGAVVFQGNVDLHARESIVFGTGVIGDTSTAAAVTISSAYVDFAGYTEAAAAGTADLNPSYPAVASFSTLTVQADLIDVSDLVYLGGSEPVSTPVTRTAGGSASPPGFGAPAQAVITNPYGFGQANFDSAGDIRFFGSTGPVLTTGQLVSIGNLGFTAAQLYPTTGNAADGTTSVQPAKMQVIAGYNPGYGATGGLDPITDGGTITVRGLGGAAPPAPFSVGGQLTLVADDIVQAGIIRAPEGVIAFTDASTQGGTVYPSQVTLEPGSITSVSLYGQTIPYGGTVDGVSYQAPGGATAITFDPEVAIQAQSVSVAQGATIDLRGGGTLSGAGFVAGRGGSVDVLTTSLLNISGGQAVANAAAQVAAIQPVDSGDPVFAILPGYGSTYAPALQSGDSAYSTPRIGEQITVGTGIAGLAAGTYTLLPAYYALLPGAFRVELTSGSVPAGTEASLGNDTSVAPVRIGIANTGILSPTAIAALFTSSANVRNLAEYDEETYNAFEATAATQFGNARPFLPQDAKTLLLTYPSTTGTGTALSFAPSALLDSPDPVAGGYGATLEIDTTAPIAIAGPGDAAAPGYLVLGASTLDNLDVPRLVIGGTLSVDQNSPSDIDITGDAQTVVVLRHADLSAGDIMLLASAAGSTSIEVFGGATLTTAGASTGAYDSTSGFYFNNEQTTGIAVPVLDVASGNDAFIPNTDASNNAFITVGAGSSLLATGSLNIVAPSGTEVTIDNATLGAKSANIAVSAINIGSAAALAEAASGLPSGLDITASSLASLLGGDAAAGIPAATELALTANQEVNILGSVQLQSSATDIVLNTPAIYGIGSAGNVAEIDAPAFTWNGVATQNLIAGQSPIAASALPGGQIAAGLANERNPSPSLLGTLLVKAGTITLGYGPDTQANDQLELDRLVVGFANVVLQASGEITANNQSGLTVYATQTSYGQAGSGGNLSLLAPLITSDAAAVLKLTAGGSLVLATPAGTAPASTAGIATLGGEFDLTAGSIAIDTAIALPAGQFTATAQHNIDLGAGASIDLAGRVTHLLDQTAYSDGGTLSLESTAGSILLQAAAGSLAAASIDVSSPGAAAGSVSLSALAGDVTLDGTLLGSAPASQTGGSFSVLGGTLSAGGAGAAAGVFDLINTGLNAGGFTASRSFEFGVLSTGTGAGADATTDLVIDGSASAPILVAHSIAITDDLGSIDITGTVDASGATPGSIALQAAGNLTLAATGVLDAHATSIAVDSNGQPIDAENRAQVTLTSSAGTLALDGGTINLTYPAQDPADLQGQLVLNAPRNAANNDVAIVAADPITVLGAQSIALYAWKTYSVTTADGIVAQISSDHPDGTGPVLGLNSIDADNQAFMTAAGASAGLQARLAGLIAYGADFHLRPGVEIDSSAASGGKITIYGDLDLSGLRYSDVGYGTAVTKNVYGSGEAGAIVFRASNDLIVNGSVTDGFDPPPDSQSGNELKADDGWVFIGGHPNPLNADVFLPDSITDLSAAGGVIGHQVELGKGTIFDNTRAVSLNYGITIYKAMIDADTVIPFAATLRLPVTIPQGGFVTTAPITTATGAIIPAGTYLAGGTVIAADSTIAAGTMLPVAITVKNGTVVPAGTMLSIFANPIQLYSDTDPLPDNAFIPSNTDPVFLTPAGKRVAEVALREDRDIDADGNAVQGYLYALSDLLPAGSQSWDMSFVSGANLASANSAAVQARSVLNGGALATAANTDYQAPGSLILDDQHDLNPTGGVNNDDPAFSVIRTGTGNLSLIAGGNFDQSSLYGIYTAGTQDPLPGGYAVNVAYDSKRKGLAGSGNIALPHDATINQIVAETYQANYPTDGGNVLLSAQGSVTGDLYAPGTGSGDQIASDALGNWLWRQGSTQLGQPTAWWINFGTFVTPYTADDESSTNGPPQLAGFQGIGTLGGGNVTVIAGTDAGQMTDREGGGASTNAQLRGEGLVIAVASTGREVTSNGTSTIVETGGGNLTVHIGGTLNPLDAAAYGLTTRTDSANDSPVTGDLIDLRGNITVTAGAIGRDDPVFSTTQIDDPRAADPTIPVYQANDGITLVPGDGTVTIDTLRDLVLDGVGDAGRVTEQNLTLIDTRAFGTYADAGGGDTGFTLWMPNTAITLFSAGGNVTPVTANLSYASVAVINDAATDGGIVYPSQLYVTAATGDIVYGGLLQSSGTTTAGFLQTMPSANEQVSFLAGTSIEANGFAIDMSGADPAGLSTPLNPAFSSDIAIGSTGDRPALTNILAGGGTEQSAGALFAQQADTPTVGYLSQAAQAAPALFYAANGDILDFITGETLSFTEGADEALPQWYLAAKPVQIEAARDIVSSGTRPQGSAGGLQQNQTSVSAASGLAYQYISASGNLFLNNSANSVSVVAAGRDILSGYFYVGGPGLLDVNAGRNIDQIGYTYGDSQLLDYGSIKSLGSLLTGAPVSLTGGAGIDVEAGLGTGADYTAFADLYLNPANQANLALPITDPANQGKVQQVYTAELLTWLQQNYAYGGSAAGALAYFLDAANVPLASQQAFLRGIFYDELLAGGRQYNDPTSRFFHSYVRGRQAITALLPGQNGQTTPTSGTNYGDPQGYIGTITMLSGDVERVSGLFDAGVATEHGGDIDVLDPGGQVELGTSGEQTPGGGTGLVTVGAGNIAVFATGSVLLGKSRVFTDDGGNIQIWSADGDINAGIGARTTVVYDAPVISYDATGGLVESPSVPTSGAGIATEQPLPDVPAGDIDLTAPLGTIDAGEAGVRASGDLNLAAARLANTSGFTAGGKTTGNSAPPSVSLASVEAAGAAAGAATSAAQNGAPAQAAAQLPSIIEVEVLSVTDDDQRKKKGR